MIKEQDLSLYFNINDKQNIGRPLRFSVNKWLDLVCHYVACDEVERALWLLENPPAWYRDHYPIEAKQLKDKIFQQFFTTQNYSKENLDASQIETEIVVGEWCESTERYELTKQVISGYKNIPHIYEMGPGDYWLPVVLKKNNFKFTYFSESLEKNQDRRAQFNLKGSWCDSPISNDAIFICFEVIEHLHNPIEIYQNFVKYKAKHNIDFKHILLSTPMYSYGGGNLNWPNSDLGHLRAYTPREFLDFALKYWPEYSLQINTGPVMTIMGIKND